VEIEVAARHFSSHWLYQGEAASLAALRTAAQQADILHLATHGLFRPDNPFCSVLKLADGWADVRTLYELPLTAQLVVLSACESGAVAVRGGDEVIGLARGFLAAGARSLLVSLWNVHDASAASLMDELYGALTGSAPRPAVAYGSVERDPQRPAALRVGALYCNWGLK
jgi:CHAT domain-containing protein